jgi:hypothetical protein
VRALHRLLELKWTYPSGPFPAAIDQALRFGLFDLGRLEALILKHVAGDFFNLDSDRDMRKDCDQIAQSSAEPACGHVGQHNGPKREFQP